MERMKTIITNMTLQDDPKALKQKYLQCCGSRASDSTVMHEVVKALVDQGVSRRMLMAWAVEAGYLKGYVSNLLSRIFLALGFRARRMGAGRKPAADTLALLEYARSQFVPRALMVLRAAARTGKAQEKAAIASLAPRSGLVDERVPSSARANANNGPIIRRIFPSAEAMFTQNIHPTNEVRNKTQEVRV
jgi:hypothetical protein